MLENIHVSGFSDEISSDFDTQLETVKLRYGIHIYKRSKWEKF